MAAVPHKTLVDDALSGRSRSTGARPLIIAGIGAWPRPQRRDGSLHPVSADILSHAKNCTTPAAPVSALYPRPASVESVSLLNNDHREIQRSPSEVRAAWVGTSSPPPAASLVPSADWQLFGVGLATLPFQPVVVGDLSPSLVPADESARTHASIGSFLIETFRRTGCSHLGAERREVVRFSHPTAFIAARWVCSGCTTFWR